jgi:murein DD-endopeptidase MepM/ murein hydrolase activator NlpD
LKSLKSRRKNTKIWTKRKNTRPRFFLFLLLSLMIILPVAWVLMLRLEGEKPSARIELSSPFIGVSQELSGTVTDQRSGVRKLWIGLLKDGKEVVLMEKDFPAGGFIRGGMVHEEPFKILIGPKLLGLTDGKAILRMTVWDYSWRGWLNGNRTYIEKEIVIDTQPPEVDILTLTHNVSQGGAGLVIFRVSEPGTKSGVVVGENFFPGHSGYFKDDDIFMAFFALNYDQGPGTQIFVKATDPAGNSARTGFPYYIKKKVFKKDVINLSDTFLNRNMPDFYTGNKQDSRMSMLEKFISVNSNLRQANTKKIKDQCKNTEKTLYWEGAFLRLPGSATRAGFADHRSYRYKGDVIDRQVHMGIDLASVSHSPVPAANRGKVIFTGAVGIYGKTIIIDHGFGLFSSYSHLSRIGVQKGQMVSKGDIIGRTGTTGLVGGDHLHFGMLVHNTFVSPLEWWDVSWIENNVLTRIKNIKSGE